MNVPQQRRDRRRCHHRVLRSSLIRWFGVWLPKNKANAAIASVALLLLLSYSGMFPSSLASIGGHVLRKPRSDTSKTTIVAAAKGGPSAFSSASSTTSLDGSSSTSPLDWLEAAVSAAAADNDQDFAEKSTRVRAVSSLAKVVMADNDLRDKPSTTANNDNENDKDDDDDDEDDDEDADDYAYGKEDNNADVKDEEDIGDNKPDGAGTDRVALVDRYPNDHLEIMNLDSPIAEGPSLRILLAITLETHRHLPFQQWALQDRKDLRLLFFSPDKAFVDANEQQVQWMPPDDWKYVYEAIGKQHGKFDWYLRCPSSAFVGMNRLQRVLQMRYPLGTSKPVYVGFQHQDGHKRKRYGNTTASTQWSSSFDGDTYCQLWNDAAVGLMQDLSPVRCEEPEGPETTNRINRPVTSTRTHAERLQECLSVKTIDSSPTTTPLEYAMPGRLRADSNNQPPPIQPISMKLLKAPKRCGTPCEIQKHHDQWMFPRLFSKQFLRSSISQWLALVYPKTFIPQDRCSCTPSPIAHRIQRCGVRLYSTMRWKECAAKLPICAVLPSSHTTSNYHNGNNDNDNYSLFHIIQRQSEEDASIPAYIISLSTPVARSRVETYLPKPTFDGHVVEGFWGLASGVSGYRESMAKALRTGLSGLKPVSNTTSRAATTDLIAVFDDDFRVSKTFQEDWKRLVASDECFHDTIANNGVFMLGTTIWAEDYWANVDAFPEKHLRDNGLCLDGTQYLRGSFASLFTRRAAEIAIEWIKATPPSRPFDWFWMDLLDLGFPVRGAVKPLIVADVEHASTVDVRRTSSHTRADVAFRHERHRWGDVDGYLPASGDVSK